MSSANARRGLRKAVIADLMALRETLQRAAVMMREEETYELPALEASIHDFLSDAHGGLCSCRTGFYSFLNLRREQEKI